MGEEIFRKKNLDKLKSPESLDECIKVTTPGVWLILTAVILLLVGACVWGAFGSIDSIAPMRVHAENGMLTGVIQEENVTAVKTGMTVRFADFEATVEDVSQKDGEYVCALAAKQAVPDGLYDASVVIQSFRPFSFILN